MAFRATISFQFGIQSHHLITARRSESPSLLSYDVQSRSSQFGIQSPGSYYGVQSHHLFSIRTFKVIFFSLAFRVVVHSMAFRATISLQLDVQSHHLFSVMTFRVVLFSLAFRVVFGIQSHHIFNLAFRVASPVWHSKPYLQFGVQSCIFSLVFRAIVCLQFDIQIHCSVWHSEFLEGHVSPQEWSSNNGILPVKRSGGFAKEGISYFREKERELRSLGGSKG
ncbi:hypothetical protein AAG906_029617 [Vitis piasezkii]